jgi:hypothetical protein
VYRVHNIGSLVHGIGIHLGPFNWRSTARTLCNLRGMLNLIWTVEPSTNGWGWPLGVMVVLRQPSTMAAAAAHRRFTPKCSGAWWCGVFSLKWCGEWGDPYSRWNAVRYSFKTAHSGGFTLPSFDNSERQLLSFSSDGKWSNGLFMPSSCPY